MAQGNAYPYPLPFPNEGQLVRISSYSSLANALGTDPGYESQQRRRHHQAEPGAVTHAQAMYLGGPPVNNFSYPYPAHNDLIPGRYPARTLLSVPSGRCSSNANTLQGESNDQNLPMLSSRFRRLPQPFCAEQDQSGSGFPTIRFLREGNQEPYSISELLDMRTMPSLKHGDLPLFTQCPYRWIKIKLNWPGYSHYPFEKRIPLQGGAPVTRTLLLITLANHINDFVRQIQKEGVMVERGQECWTITDDRSAMWKGCVITCLQHRAGSTWQPEIYYLRR